MDRHRLRIAGVTALVALVAGPALAQAASPGPSGVTGPTAPGASGAPPIAWTPSGPTATHETVRDVFDEQGSWWLGSDDVGSSSLQDGGMRWTIDQERQSIWDVLTLPDPQDVVRAEARVLVEHGSGGGGPLCAGTDPGERALWAGVNGDGEWLLGRIVDRHIQVMERGDLADLPAERDPDATVGRRQPSLVTLECTTDAQGDRAVVWVDGVQVTDTVDETVGPYRTVGLSASADQGAFSILFDDFAAYDAATSEASPAASPAPSGASPAPSGAGSDPTPSGGAQPPT